MAGVSDDSSDDSNYSGNQSQEMFMFEESDSKNSKITAKKVKLDAKNSKTDLTRDANDSDEEECQTSIVHLNHATHLNRRERSSFLQKLQKAEQLGAVADVKVHLTLCWTVAF